MSVVYRFEIDGEEVTAESIQGADGWVSALLLTGPGIYNGHIHGVGSGRTWCMPNVVNSVALGGKASPEFEDLGPNLLDLRFGEIAYFPIGV